MSEVRWKGVNELREDFLKFFEEKGHLRLPSFSLIPHNDNSLLLINSGMAPLKPYFTGQEKPPRTRVTTCQKCIRTGDIENVGKTARHGTFFEMLGNFSFGDYFKKEAIKWSWEFLTSVVGLPKDRLYPSVYVDDAEAWEIWNKDIGIEADRIFKLGKEDNFWEHGKGPCGPCSEIYYDRGEKYGCGKADCTVGCDCDRYMEIWNNVFTQFEGDGKGNYTELAQKNIDTGMGLERLAVVCQDVGSIFDIDTLVHLRGEICSISSKEYGKDPEIDVSVRVITDHIRSVTMMASDGITPSNEGRGYVMRRLLRRAARHGRLLGIKEGFLAELAKCVISDSGEAYPELKDRQDFIVNVIGGEEEKFAETIDKGLSILEEMVKTVGKDRVLSGSDAFKLYDTYGFPLDLTEEILAESSIKVDRKDFEKEMDRQKNVARSARKATNYMGAEETVFDGLSEKITSEFVGYDSLYCKGKILAITKREEKDGVEKKEADEVADFTDTNLVTSLIEGERGTVIVDKTSLYATMGGQEGDTGFIRTSDGEFRVYTTVKLKGDQIGHIGIVTKGIIMQNAPAEMYADKKNREETCKNHSATHLLQAALKKILGNHVEQKGSLVSGDRLRFDYSHFKNLDKPEIEEVEELINEEIAQDLSVTTEEMPIAEAKERGAMALFGEKYGDVVRVVSIGDASIELCGGTHVKRTGSIGGFKIISESGISSGVRRIEALTGEGLRKYYDDIEDTLKTAADLIKADPHNFNKKLESLLEEIKDLKASNASMKSELAATALKSAEREETEISGFKFISEVLTGVEGDNLRDLGDKLKTEAGSGVVLLISKGEGGNLSILCMATDDAVKAGVNAGKIIKEAAPCVGGRGGGRPNMAQAGGSDPSGIDKLIEKSEEIIKTQLSE